MGMASPPAKRLRYFETHDESSTSTYCAYAALDTSTVEQDEDDQEDACFRLRFMLFLSTTDSLAQEVKTSIGSTPLTNFWSHIAKQGFTGIDQKLIPVSEIIKGYKLVMHQTTLPVKEESLH